jgi:hypothetical protein
MIAQLSDAGCHIHAVDPLDVSSHAATTANIDRRLVLIGSMSIRPHVRDLVELCAFVRDSKALAPEARESLRKIKWKRAKQEEQRLAELRQQQLDAAVLCSESEHNTSDPAPQEDPSPEAADELPPTEPSVPKAKGIGQDVGAARSLDELVAEIQRRDVTASCRSLRGDPSDPLGAISVPCKRDGNSLTLCTLDDSPRLLVVFGGRVLQDTAVLRPSAIEARDPVLRERIRYTFSNAVYVYDMATQLWRFQECSGKPPKERCDHSALFLAPRFLLVFGGRGRNGQVFRDLHALSLESWRWWQVDHESPPMERYWHGWCAGDSSSIFLFGGRSDALVYGDLMQLRASSVTRWLEAQEQQLALQAASVSAPEVLTPRRIAPPAWLSPDTVGKPPSRRFGMQVIALENDQIAVVGGWRDEPRGRSRAAGPKPMDVHILDTVTLLWSTPRPSSLVCATPSMPTERMLFECFYASQTLVVFGGHTYAVTGESEPFTEFPDACQALYSLDLPRMIWRRQKLSLPPPHAHSSGANVLVEQAGGGFTGLTCSSGNGKAGEPPVLELHAVSLPLD